MYDRVMQIKYVTYFDFMGDRAELILSEATQPWIAYRMRKGTVAAETWHPLTHFFFF